jgi:hypothetical protein
MNRLMDVWDKVRNEFLANNEGVSWPVLLEKKIDTTRQGRTANYIEVVIPDPKGVLKRGQVVNWTI